MLFKRRGLKDQGLPRGHYLEHFWHADLGYVGQAIIGVKVPNDSHVASIQHWRVPALKNANILALKFWNELFNIPSVD